ncbi:MAG: TetR/AcrR family transcriptional regulator [Myxococcota bacterium]
MTFRADFEHRDALLRAALDEFCERGYDAASINRILSASGVSKGQLYHHFATKEGLYLALVEWMIDQKTAWFARHPLAPNEDFLETLGAQLRATLDFAAAHPDVDRLSRALLGERGRPIFAEVVRRFGFDPDSAFGSMIAHYHARGQFRGELSLAFVRGVVLLIVNHAAELLDLRGAKDLGARVDELLAFLRGGLSRP